MMKPDCNVADDATARGLFQNSMKLVLSFLGKHEGPPDARGIVYPFCSLVETKKPSSYEESNSQLLGCPSFVFPNHGYRVYNPLLTACSTTVFTAYNAVITMVNHASYIPSIQVGGQFASVAAGHWLSCGQHGAARGVAA